MTKIVPRSFGTHDGSFHADEVTACALLLLFDLIDRKKIVRTRDPDQLERCEYVCDVGGSYHPGQKRFDHHQVEYDGYLSSAGMVLLYLKEKGKLDEGAYDFFNRSLILGVDAHDTGRIELPVGTCSFSHVISNFVPPQYDVPAQVQTEAFLEALDFVGGHLKRLLERYHYISSCRSQVKQAMEKNLPYLLFEAPIPWQESFFALEGGRHPALFVVMPSEGVWKVRAIPYSLEERMRVRHPLPAAWAGLRDKELEAKSGIPGAIFCHKGRFISIWQTKEAAMKALEKALK